MYVHTKRSNRWPQDIVKIKHDPEIVSESEYEESKTESSLSVSNDYFTKIVSSIDSIKTDIKIPSSMVDKIDTILEFSKAIDADVKNIYELLVMMNKNEESFTAEQLKDIIIHAFPQVLPQPPLIQPIQPIQPIQYDSNHSLLNKIRLKLESFDDQLKQHDSSMDVLQLKMETLQKQQYYILLQIQKLQSTIDLLHFNQQIPLPPVVQPEKQVQPVQVVPPVQDVADTENVSELISEPSESVSEEVNVEEVKVEVKVEEVKVEEVKVEEQSEQRMDTDPVIEELKDVEEQVIQHIDDDNQHEKQTIIQPSSPHFIKLNSAPVKKMIKRSKK
ncbi:MAG TPA: hypothetical protein VLG50_05615 [Candidatus Saccharimonadales bacterium]|nr:hypothetical protein [Candidatus Saccharimonadales bacterium]